MPLARMAHVGVNRVPVRHLFEHKQGWRVEQQRLDPEEGVRLKVPTRGVDGGSLVLCGVGGQQDMDEAGGGQAPRLNCPSAKAAANAPTIGAMIASNHRRI